MQKMGQTAIVLAGVSDDTSVGIQNSLKLVSDGLGSPSKHGVAVVHMIHLCIPIGPHGAIQMLYYYYYNCVD